MARMVAGVGAGEREGSLPPATGEVAGPDDDEAGGAVTMVSRAAGTRP